MDQPFNEEWGRFFEISNYRSDFFDFFLLSDRLGHAWRRILHEIRRYDSISPTSSMLLSVICNHQAYCVVKFKNNVARVPGSGLEEEESAYGSLVCYKSFEGERETLVRRIGTRDPRDLVPGMAGVSGRRRGIAEAVVGIKEEGDRVRAITESKPHQTVALEGGRLWRLLR